MIAWRALVPIKQGANGKSRLASAMSHEERDALALRMALHVLAELAKCGSITEIAILSTYCPEWWGGAWVEDRGAGLNAEIAGWRRSIGAAPVLIVHADLPLLRASEIDELLEVAAAEGIALATDRAGEGTNALAIADGRAFDFRFGPNSRLHHAEQAPGLAVLDLPGLTADIDTPEDLAFVRAHGFVG
jgi:2-phospho-L-lactate guanylyltransferase